LVAPSVSLASTWGEKGRGGTARLVAVQRVKSYAATGTMHSGPGALLVTCATQWAEACDNRNVVEEDNQIDL
jgi:hypothetical protein